MIRDEPGNVSVKTIGQEAFKLGAIRAAGLPGDLFAGAAPMVLTGWCRRWRREHRIARRGPARILSRCGISSPDASRVNPVSNAASSGSESATRPVIESRACCSRTLRLIAGPSSAWPCPDPQKRQEETGEAWLRHLSCVQWSATRTRWRCSWRGSYRCPSSRNGYRRRERDTRAGTIELAIPKLRAGSYFPSFASTAAGPSGRWPRSWRPATCWAP